jgi:aspartate/methionine/tyrosine aminotransferase
LDLTVTNPLSVGIAPSRAVPEALAKAAGELRYEPAPFGLVSAREAVAKLWAERGIETSADRVVMTASTSEAYAYALKLLCDPDDEILVPAPSYPLFEHLGRLENVTLVPYRLDYDGAWFIDVPAIERLVTQRTRAVFVVSPNNPTGSYLKRDELARLARLALPIVSDEVFAEYPLCEDPRRVRSSLDAPGSLVIALDGLSKSAALPQLKLAWMTLGGPAQAVAEAMSRLELVADTFLSASTPVQAALPSLLDSRAVAAGARPGRSGGYIREQPRRCFACRERETTKTGRSRCSSSASSFSRGTFSTSTRAPTWS